MLCCRRSVEASSVGLGECGNAVVIRCGGVGRVKALRGVAVVCFTLHVEPYSAAVERRPAMGSRGKERRGYGLVSTGSLGMEG